MKCDAPETTTGGTFSCHGQETNFGDTCSLDCHISNGYTGDTVFTCNVDDEDESVSWGYIPTCTRKLIHFCSKSGVNSYLYYKKQIISLLKGDCE